MLGGCSFPLAAVPAVRPHMMQLSRVTLDLLCFTGISRNELESVLVLLCRPLPGAPPLSHLQCFGCYQWMDVYECRNSVLQQLEVDFGVTSVSVMIT